MGVPTVITNAVTVLGYDEVTLNGNITDDGGDAIVSHGFCWSTTNAIPTIADTYSDLGVGAEGTFNQTVNLLSLEEGSYYVRAYVTNIDQAFYGVVQTFELSENAPQGNLYCEFDDVEGNSFKIQIYRPDHFGDTEYQIPTKCGAGVSRNHGGGGKNSFEDTVIQGQELIFQFHMPSADISYIDYLLESRWKDYVVVYYAVDGETESEIFRGYLKPENLTKQYETRSPYIDIELSASDSLIELDYIEFKDADEELIISSGYTVLEIIKKCLEKIADPGGLDLDFKIQLGTYETSLMTSAECALAKLTVDTRAFIEGEWKEDKTISCYRVIEQLLKPFNVFFKQEKGYYHIHNPHELESKEFVFDWETLTQQSREDTSVIKDVSDNDFLYIARLVEQQKIHPLKYGFVTHRNSDIVSELISDDWNDYDIENWSGYEISAAGELSLIYYSLNKDTEPKPTITLRSPIFIPAHSDTDRLVFRFTFTLTHIQKPEDAGFLKWKVEIRGPESEEYREPSYWDVWAVNYGYAVEAIVDPESSDAYKVTADGYYSVRLTLHVEGGGDSGYTVNFRLKDPSMKIHSYTGLAQITQKEPEYDIAPTGSPRRGSTTVIRDQIDSSRGVSSTSSSISGARRRNWSDTEKDRIFKLEQPNGYETFESDLHFADGITDEVIESGAFLIDATLTSAWSRYGVSEALSLVNIYVANVIDNRASYKNYLRCVIIDRNHEIDFTSILTIEDKNYFILSYYRNYIDGTLETELVELITTKLSYEDGIELVDKSSMIAINSPVPALVSEGEFQPLHEFEVGDVIRYNKSTEEYVRALANTVDNAKAIGIVSNVLTGDIFKFISDDYIRSDSELYKALQTKYDLEEGEYYFLDPNVEGGMLKSAELQPGDIEQCVGYVTTKGFKIEIDARMIELPYPLRSSGFFYAGGVEDCEIDFDEVSREFIITPIEEVALDSGESSGELIIRFRFFYWGVKALLATKTEEETIELPDEDGLYLVYYNTIYDSTREAVNELEYEKNPDEETIKEIYTGKVIVAWIYWDSIAQECLYFGDERHGSQWIPQENWWAHRVFNGKRVSGLNVTNIPPLRNSYDGSSNVHAQVGIEAGVWAHEDIEIDVVEFEMGDAWSVFWYDLNSDLNTPNYDASIYPLLLSGSGSKVQYNPDGDGLDDVSDGYYFMMHLFATNCVFNPMVAVIGQSQWATFEECYTEMESELHTVMENMVQQSKVYLKTVIYQVSSAYSNDVEARIVGFFKSGGLSEIPFEYCVEPGEALTKTLDIYVTDGYTISKAIMETDAGSLTDISIKIGSVAVTGISGVTVPNSRTVFTATANNIAIAGDRIYLVVGTGYSGTPVFIVGKIVLA